MNKYLKTILQEICQRVGADYKSMNFKKRNWFHDYSWSEKQEEDFKNWLIDYLKNNKEARSELMSIPSSNKQILTRFASEFLFNYGWKLHD